MKILITGAAGFIGHHLMNELKSRPDFEVKGVDNFFHPCKAPHDDVEYADIRYYSQIEKYVEWADIVFHLAAQIHVDRSIHYPSETIDINVKGTQNILEAVRKFDKKMVFASTSEVYGTAQADKISEDHPLDAQSPYAASKVAGDRLCKAYHDTFGTKVIILRNFNVFGEWQNDQSYGSVISIFTKQALTGANITINGDGSQERDYMHVKDAVKAYVACLWLEEYGTPINMGSGKSISIADLAKLIWEITSSKSDIIYREARAGEVMRLCADIKKAESLGIMPSTNFENDLANYIDWYGKTQLT